MEGNFTQRDSWHFTLRYEGRATSLTLQRDLLGTLEEQYLDLSRELHYRPNENISVVLYTTEQFFDITRAPSWAGALNDGKLRIPLGGITTITPELQSVLKHELTHSFVRLMSAGRCPTWLNEGLATALESDTLGWAERRVQQARPVPLTLLRQSFGQYSGGQAALAYATSALAVRRMLQDAGGFAVANLIRDLGDGVDFDTAFSHRIQRSFDDFQAALQP